MDSADLVVELMAAGLSKVSSAIVTVSDTITAVEPPPPPLTAASPPPPPPPSPPPKSLVADDESSSVGGFRAGRAHRTMVIIQILFLILCMLLGHGDY